jgi:di/tricarboxylate transporter
LHRQSSTTAAALLHFFAHLLIAPPLGHVFISTFAALAIVLPAFGSSLAAIRNHSEYQRNAERYRFMIQYLTTIRNEMSHSHSQKNLMKLVEEANELMMNEQMEWRVLFRVHRVEMP